MSSVTSHGYSIEARWEARCEPVEQSAARVLEMLRMLGRCKPQFDRWIRTGWTRRESGVPFSTMPPQIGPMVRLLEAGRVGIRKGWPYLSSAHRFRARNTTIGHPAYLSGSIDWSNTIQDLPNHISIDLQYEAEAELQRYSIDFLRSVLLALADAWEPAVVRIDFPGLWTQHYKDNGCPEVLRFRAGWMTYLAPQFACRIQPPPSALVELLPDGGTLISATHERFEIENPGHLAAYDAIQAAMTPLNEMAWPPADHVRTRPSLPEVGPAS